MEIALRKRDIESEGTLILNRSHQHKKNGQAAKNNYVSQERSGMSVPGDEAVESLTWGRNRRNESISSALVVLLSAVAACEESADPSGLSHTLWLWDSRGESLPLSSDPLRACQGHHMSPVSPLITVQLTPLENLLVRCLPAQGLQRSCFLLENAQKSCLFMVTAQKESSGRWRTALGKIRNGVGFLLRL